MGRQWHVSGANLPDGGQLGSDVAQKRSHIIDGSEAGQTSVKLPQSRAVASVGLQMRISDGVNGSEGDDESYNPCGEAVHLKDTV